MVCQRCNGLGYLLTRGDDDVICPTCEGSGYDPLALIAHYEHRYRGYEIAIITHRDRVLLETARDMYWYRCGLYDILGYDRQGRTYSQYKEDDTYYEADDLRQWNAEQDRRRAELRG